MTTELGTTMMGELLTVASGRTAGLAKALLAGIDPKDFASMPVVGGKLVHTNHPAFVYGHLALYPARVLGMIGVDASDVACPDSYAGLFAAGVECEHDPERTKYPPMDEIVGRFERGTTRLTEVVRHTDDAKLAAPIQGNDRYREVFGTVGGAAGFMMHDHCMFHLGQVSAWRRMMGLGAAM